MATSTSPKGWISVESSQVSEASKVSLGDSTFNSAFIPPLDTSLYNLSPKEAAFFKKHIGIYDDDELKEHILNVQAKAYKVAPYPCVHGFTFLRLNLSTYPVYEHILKIGRERPNAVFLDVGCCFGLDARGAAVDGFPAENIIASDIHKEFLELSHELFRSTPATYAGHFIPGDVFDPEFLSIVAPSEDISLSAADVNLSSLKSFNPLHGRISVINATRLFHLFNEEKQLDLARALASLLSAQSGSIICGDQIGTREKGITTNNLGGAQLFCHTPESWTAMWDKVFPKGSVKIEAELIEGFIQRKLLLRWCVIRL